MKVLEIKNNLVKISYTTADNLILGGFVIIEDEQTPYVAQVLSLKADNGMNYAIVKLLFTFNEEGIVKNYDGTIPSLDASITKLSSDELLDILPVNIPIEIGELAQQELVLKVDSSILEKNLLVCSENQENTNTLISNFVLQLENNNDKSLIFDIDGSYPGEKLIFGTDFKLPLNYDTINYIYEHDLEDVDAGSKAVIQDIFLEVQEYSKTVLDKFIPFDTFINVVDQQYRTTGITELILLKNKLLKYKEQNVFAQDAKDIQRLRAVIRANSSNILDISTIDEKLQNEVISYVYDVIDELDLFVYTFTQFTNDNADKKLIRHMISKDKAYTTIICSHNFKYLYELKERANNLILFAPQTLQHDFAAYNTFLNKLNPDEFVIYGKSTQNIPLIVELAAIEPETEEDSVMTESASNQDETQEAAVAAEDENKEDEKPDDFSDESNSYSYETLIEDTAPVQQEEQPEQDTSVETEDYSSYEEEKEEAVQDEIQVAPEQISNIIDAEIEQEKAELPELSIQEEPLIAEPELDVIQPETPDPAPVAEQIIEATPQNEIVEEDEEEEGFPEVLGVPEPQVETISALEPLAEEVHEDDLLMNPIIEEPMDMPVLEYNDDSLPIITEPEIVEEENPVDKVAKDVDELLFSQEKQEIPPIDEIEEPEPETDLTEDDLNFIEDINNNVEEEKPPVVPVYPTEDPGEAPAFEQGDRVTHPKYGEGVVEKMIKYGNKTLCSINFVNVGRRLLDPAISEMSKVN